MGYTINPLTSKLDAVGEGTMTYKFNPFTSKLDLVTIAALIVRFLLLESGVRCLLESGDRIQLEG